MNRQEERREKERRWEMVELKDGQQQETGQADISLTPDVDGTGSPC